jgi:hypothetical protein
MLPLCCSRNSLEGGKLCPGESHPSAHLLSEEMQTTIINFEEESSYMKENIHPVIPKHHDEM